MSEFTITVTVKSAYLDQYSRPAQCHFAFVYTMGIENGGHVPAKLLSRHWIITDANNTVQEVRGSGVVGKQPVIPPGKTYTYSSNVILATPAGTMEGSYTMLTDDGEVFDVRVPIFSLTCPRSLH